MFKNYLKITIRNLVKHKSYSFIHIIGLTVGITCLILILKYVQHELSYDKFNINADQIYRITGYNWATTQTPLASALRDFYPDIINTVRIKKEDKVLLSADQNKFYEENIIFSDASIFDVFSFPMLKGDQHAALNDPYSVVLTEETAHKYFGDQNPIGKKINYDGRFDFQVTGVLANIPNNSHLKFDFVFSLACAPTVFSKDFLENRMNTSVYNYFQVRPKSNFLLIESNLDKFTKSYLGDELYNMSRTGEFRIEYKIQPLTSIHLYSNLGGELEPNGDIKNVYIFSIIAVLILLIACINYMNLSTVRYMNRLKEVGIRKVVGATRYHIVKLFIGESILLSFVAVILAYILTQILSPWLSSNLGSKDLFAGQSYGYILLLIVIALFTGIFSGIYPAVTLSRFHPVNILSKTILKKNKRLNYRSALITFQFVVSIIMIITTLIVSYQLSFLRNKNLGFNKDQIIVLPLHSNPTRSQSESMKNEILQQSGIVNATLSSIVPGGVKWVRSFRWEGQNAKDKNTMGYISADNDFGKTYQIQFLEGRDLSNTYSSDETTGFLINQAAQKKLSWKSPIGKKIETFEKQGTVIGLMKDFHFKSLHEKIEPLVIFNNPGNFAYLSIRMKAENALDIIPAIENKWKSFFPDKPFEYFFLDEYWGKLYEKEQKTSNLFLCFSGLAIFIACLGLFGLAAFSAQNKTKEIGIRKVLGASVSGIVSHLSMEFLKWVIIANIIAWPVAYYITNKWLQDFAYRIDISWWVFVLSGGIALIIAIATVSVHAIKAAIANPIEALRYE
jgi:putative ABC transport system permease protein